jgi:integrase
VVERIKTFVPSLEKRKQSIRKWKVPQKTRSDVLSFLDDLGLGKVNRGVKISAEGQLKYFDMLRVPFEFWNKEIRRLTLKDVEAFETALSTDRIHTRFKIRPYSQATKADLRKALKVFVRWKLGESRALKLVGWLDTRYREKTPDYLKEAGVEKLFKKCRTGEQRFAVAVLFDSGARAGEFLNIRYEDIELPKAQSNQDFIRLTLREEYSKTKGRTISLYWKHSLEAVRDYLEERTAQGMQSKDPMFNNTYGSMRMFLQRLGKRVLNRSLYPHLLRHSSATYYATRLNRQELCYRYGWRFSSNMPDVYISRAGMENKDLDEKFTHTELATLKGQLVQLDQEVKIKGDTIRNMEALLVALQQNFEAIYKVIERKPPVEEVQKALERKRAKRSGTEQPGGAGVVTV